MRGRVSGFFLPFDAFPDKKGGLQSETAPSFSWLLVSDFDDCDDPVVAVNDDDLITNNEVHVPAPLGMDFDERRGNLYHPDASWHRGANADGEVALFTRGTFPPAKTVCRISVRCCVVRLTLPPAWPCCA